MRAMSLRVRFNRWVEREIGSDAALALREHMRVRDYRVCSSVEDLSFCEHEVYHPDHGFFRAAGETEREVFHQILMQIWLMDGLAQPEPEPGGTWTP